jgi:hypothetical protein
MYRQYTKNTIKEKVHHQIKNVQKLRFSGLHRNPGQSGGEIENQKHEAVPNRFTDGTHRTEKLHGKRNLYRPFMAFESLYGISAVQHRSIF